MQRPQMQIIAGVILSHPPLQFCSGTVFRGTCAIALGYMAAGCPDYGLSDGALASLGRIPPATWREHGAGIKAALDSLLPILAHKYAQAQNRSANYHSALSENGKLGGFAKARKGSWAANAETPPPQCNPSPPQPMPLRTPQHYQQAKLSGRNVPPAIGGDVKFRDG